MQTAYCSCRGIAFSDIVASATAIRTVERNQALGTAEGQVFANSCAFSEYLAQRRSNPQYSFRQHLRQIGGAIPKNEPPGRASGARRQSSLSKQHLRSRIKTSPCGSGQRCADTHATNPAGCEIGYAGTGARDHDVHGLGANGFNDPHISGNSYTPGTPQTVGSGFGIRNETTDRRLRSGFPMKCPSDRPMRTTSSPD